MQHIKARENQQCTFMEMRNKGPRNTPQQPPQAQGTMVIHHGRPTCGAFCTWREVQDEVVRTWKMARQTYQMRLTWADCFFLLGIGRQDPLPHEALPLALPLPALALPALALPLPLLHSGAVERNCCLKFSLKERREPTRTSTNAQ